MTLDEFQSVIKIGDICCIQSTWNSNTNCKIFNVEYRGMWDCEEGKDLLHFRVLNGNWHVQISLRHIKDVYNLVVYFCDG